MAIGQLDPYTAAILFGNFHPQPPPLGTLPPGFRPGEDQGDALLPGAAPMQPQNVLPGPVPPTGGNLPVPAPVAPPIESGGTTRIERMNTPSILAPTARPQVAAPPFLSMGIPSGAPPMGSIGARAGNAITPPAIPASAPGSAEAGTPFNPFPAAPADIGSVMEALGIPAPTPEEMAALMERGTMNAPVRPGAVGEAIVGPPMDLRSSAQTGTADPAAAAGEQPNRLKQLLESLSSAAPPAAGQSNAPNAPSPPPQRDFDSNIGQLLMQLLNGASGGGGGQPQGPLLSQLLGG